MYADVDEWQGSIAGDALYFTAQTMEAFYEFGRHGWNNANAPADIVVNSSLGNGCCAHFIADPAGTPEVPGPAVVLNPVPYGSGLYSSAAALDQVAHEWGHGVVAAGANFPQTDVGRQLDEGFADVVGLLVKKTYQRPGYGVEQSSGWSLGEDMTGAPVPYPLVSNTCYFYSGDIDDGLGHTCGGLQFNNKMHVSDEIGSGSNHDRGNMLNVAYYLLSQGGPNPACYRFFNCGISVTAPFGYHDAGKLLFDMIQFYLPSGASWGSLPSYSDIAAFNTFSRCSANPKYSAEDKQEQARLAFGTIGFLGSGPYITCP